MPALQGLSSAELVALLTEKGHPAMRGRQLATHLYQRAAQSLDALPDLPKALRDSLKAEFRVSPISIATHRKSSDGVEKLLVHNGDGQVYECVLLPYEKRVSCCISTQVGCPMGCTFCATGLGGFDRNLTAG